jgi:hypothetical protein
VKSARTKVPESGGELPHGSDPRSGPALPVLLGALLILWTVFLVAMAYLQHTRR